MRNPHKLSLVDYLSLDKPDKNFGLLPVIDQSLDDTVYDTVSVCDKYPLDWTSQIVPVRNKGNSAQPNGMFSLSIGNRKYFLEMLQVFDRVLGPFELLSLVTEPLQHLIDLTKKPLPKGFIVKFEMP